MLVSRMVFGSELVAKIVSKLIRRIKTCSMLINDSLLLTAAVYGVYEWI